MAGGFAANGSSLASVEAYDPASNTWTSIAPLPQARNHLGLAALGGKLYAVGGYGQTMRDPNADAWAYDPASDSWAAIAPLPVPRAAHALVATGDKLFAIGGVGPSAGTTLAYDPATDAWERRAEIPTPREHLAATIADDRIYAIAGRDAGRNLDIVESYDPATDSWITLPPLPTARSGLAAAALGRADLCDRRRGARWQRPRPSPSWKCSTSSQGSGIQPRQCPPRGTAWQR